MNMNLPDSWSQEDVLVSHLAHELHRGRLGLFLGAGLSAFYGMPQWSELVNRLAARVGAPLMKPGDDPILKVGAIRAKYYANRKAAFLADVREELYRGKVVDFDSIRQNDTLAAIGALVMSSKRGSASKVISLNYDDLLELYLEHHGFVTTSVWEDHHWANNDDVTVYHPHGFLPLSDRPCSDDIVFATAEYYGIMQSDFWRPLLQTHLRTRTFIYIGLSGNDMHIQSLISGIKNKHAIAKDRIAFHSVRFSLGGSGDEVGEMLREEGVFTHTIANYEELPRFLFKICQAARLLRTQR